MQLYPRAKIHNFTTIKIIIKEKHFNSPKIYTSKNLFQYILNKILNFKKEKKYRRNIAPQEKPKRATTKERDFFLLKLPLVIFLGARKN